MSAISQWSKTAANNNSASPDGFPEGMAPSGVNNSARENMAAVRTWYEDAEWTDLGHTPTFVSATSFTIATDVTATYETNRRLKLFGTVMGTLYGTISSSSYSAPNTTVNVTLDSGSLTSNLSQVYVSILTESNTAIPGGAVTESSTTTFTNKTFDANGTGNSITNIEPADLATGTDGALISWDAAGNPTTIAPGTSGYALKSNGAGAEPTYQEPDVVLISTATASNSSSIDFTGLSTSYKFYKLLINNLVPATDGVDVYFRVSTDGGSSYKSGASDYRTAVRVTNDAASQAANGSSTAASHILLNTTSDSIGNATGESLSSEITIYNPASSSTYTYIGFLTASEEASVGHVGVTQGAGQYKASTAVDGIRIILSSGNISSGDFYLYGYKA